MSDSLTDLSRALGIEIIDSKVDSGSGFTFGLRIKDLVAPFGLQMLVQQSLLSTKTQIVFDNFPGDLFHLCKTSFELRHEEIFSVIAGAESCGVEVTFLVDGKKISNEFIQTEWRNIVLVLHKKVSNYEEAANALQMTILIGFSILLPLITEESDGLLENISQEFREEGGVSVVQVNRYERSRVNRAICLEIHGFVCGGCRTRMADVYGPIGENVIHVHHIEPVSLMKASRVLNPATDLIPLCPNCHTIVHRTSPPIQIDELIKLIASV